MKRDKRSDEILNRTRLDAEKKFNEIQTSYGVLAILALNLLLQAVVSVGSHSGLGKPPLHGDYEAQRHWMEITINLPIHKW